MTATDDALRAMGEGFQAGIALQGLEEAGAGPVMEGREGLHGPSVAVYGGGGTYRYLLTNRWGDEPAALVVVGLNSSTATHVRTDPTWTRVVHRAARLEWRGRRFGAAVMVNLFALRSPDPAALEKHPDPVGPGNDAVLRAFCRPRDTVIAAWGDGGAYRVRDAEVARGAQVAAMLAEDGVELLCLGVTAKGHPRHPGRLAYSEPVRPWRLA